MNISPKLAPVGIIKAVKIVMKLRMTFIFEIERMKPLRKFIDTFCDSLGLLVAM